jgi:hypothetical protein
MAIEKSMLFFNLSLACWIFFLTNCVEDLVWSIFSNQPDIQEIGKLKVMLGILISNI